MSDEELIGKQLGEYRLDALLGQGGMARVYNATDVRLKRQAVIKLIDPPSRDDPAYMMRFEREAQIIGQLDHPNIVRLYRYDEQDGWLYMAMQHIQGADLGVVLADYRADKTFIHPNEAQRITREICSALDYAHAKGIVHRDVKPANILLDRQGRAFLSDFGLALITDIGTRGEIFGSPHYIAPEQAVSSAKAVPQSDLYAMGVILYEMFTGEVPFQAERPLDIAFLQITEPPQPPRQLRPEINPELETVILKALAKKPEKRYQTGAELADALDAALDASAAASLTAPNVPISKDSVADRVALELGEPPLPMLPAAVAEEGYAAVIDSPVVADQRQDANQPNTAHAPSIPIKPPSVDNKNLTRVAFGLGIVILFSLCCVGLLVVLPSMFRNFSASTTGQIIATATLQSDAVTPVANATKPVRTPRPTRTKKPTANVAASATPISYKLKIQRKDKKTLVITNQSDIDFPMGPLSLSTDKITLSGSAWGVDTLKAEACVDAIFKDKNDDEDEDNSNCSEWGTLSIKEKSNWLGDKAFNLFYNNKKVGSCPKNQGECVISWAVNE